MMAWLAQLGASIWAKVVLIAVFIGGILLLAMRLVAAGRDAERARDAKAAFKYQVDTAKKVSKSDEALVDPKSSRAKRVRDRFSRD